MEQDTKLPLCACGCGEVVAKRGNVYIFNHHVQPAPNTMPLCACGCGQTVRRSSSRYLQGHSSRKYCACGCGELAPPHHRFVLNHHKRITDEIPLCACGCGDRVTKAGRTFIKGHSTRVRYAHKRDPNTFPYCACGCGQRVTKAGNEWCRGHQMRAFSFAGPTEHEAKVQRAFQSRGRAFLFNLGLLSVSRPDFQFPEVKILVEIDGRDHAMARKAMKDQERDAFYGEKGWMTLRWTHRQIEADLDTLMADFEGYYQSRVFSCQGSADEPGV